MIKPNSEVPLKLNKYAFAFLVFIVLATTAHPTSPKLSTRCKVLFVGLAVGGTAIGLGEWHKNSAVQKDLAIVRGAQQSRIANAEQSPVEATRYVAGLADKLLIASGYEALKQGPLPLEVVAVRRAESRQVANFIAISEEHLAALEYEAEVAALIAHELSHAVLRHDADSLGIKHGLVWGSVRRIEQLANKRDDWGEAASPFGDHLSDAMHRHEFEADAFSLQLLQKAGYPPEAAISALIKIAKRESEGMVRLGTNTHASPSAFRRLERLNALLRSRLDIRYTHGINGTPESAAVTIPGQSSWNRIPGEKVRETPE